MDNPAANIKSSIPYTGRLHFMIWSYEGRLTFFESDKVNLVCNRTLRRHPECFVQYIWNFCHSTQTYSEGNRTYGCSSNNTSYQTHRDQSSSLLELSCKYDAVIKNIDRKGKVVRILQSLWVTSCLGISSVRLTVGSKIPSLFERESEGTCAKRVYCGDLKKGLRQKHFLEILRSTQ